MVSIVGVDFVGLDVGPTQRAEVVEDDMNGNVRDWVARSQRGLDPSPRNISSTTADNIAPI